MSHIVDPGAQSCAFYALAGLTGFVFGAYFQQESAIRQLFWMIKTDPYVFHHRRKLYPLVGVHISNGSRGQIVEPFQMSDKQNTRSSDICAI
ncbi:uncharacterized protein Dmoj_GI18046, isoform C [Drosophila mojavensis]|uniref:Uncharacterized protein, isoform C n=1 Tax=Drosophila mojavensis TaxID=7230 RepID=A0A0Q9XH60_DROMO|nr:uncharacterized protein Dmoj_GI18046, isoform C [Drosophila mojavensis]